MIPENFPRFRLTIVRRTTPKELLIRWAIWPTDYDLSDIRYEIFRSQGSSGPWELVATPEEGAYQWIDRDVNSPWNIYGYYYMVRAASVSGNGFRDTEPVYNSHDPDHIANEMIRKKEVFFRARAGVACAILGKKSWGSKCARCWDPVKKLPRDPDCPNCFGTGFAGGYLKPFYLYALVQPPRESVLRAGAPFVDGTTYAEIGPNPYVDPGDVFVDRVTNLRYRIKSVQQAAHRQYVVSQILTLAIVDENDVVYKLAIPEPSAARRGESFTSAGNEA